MKTPIDWFVEATTHQQSEHDYFELIDKANDKFKEAISLAYYNGIMNGHRENTIPIYHTEQEEIERFGYVYYKDKYEK